MTKLVLVKGYWHGFCFCSSGLVFGFFFVAGRIANNDGKDDVLWVPGLTR